MLMKTRMKVVCFSESISVRDFFKPKPSTLHAMTKSLFELCDTGFDFLKFEAHCFGGFRHLFASEAIYPFTDATDLGPH